MKKPIKGAGKANGPAFPQMVEMKWHGGFTYKLARYSATITKSIADGHYTFELWKFTMWSSRLATGERKSFALAKKALERAWKKVQWGKTVKKPKMRLAPMEWKWEGSYEGVLCKAAIQKNAPTTFDYELFVYGVQPRCEAVGMKKSLSGAKAELTKAWKKLKL